MSVATYLFLCALVLCAGRVLTWTLDHFAGVLSEDARIDTRTQWDTERGAE